METKTCGKCDLYSRSLLRCKNGKINPRTLKDTVSTMKIMGVTYICGFCKWKRTAITKL